MVRNINAREATRRGVKRDLRGATVMALLLVIGCTAVKPPAIPANPPLTANQYLHIQRGMTYDQVVAVAGPPQIPCTQYSDSKGEMTLCSWYAVAKTVPVPVPTSGIVRVLFSNGHVVKKSTGSLQ
jgi:hypothetical protein